MKRIIILLFCLLLWVSVFAKPMIEFEALEHDFGRILEEAGPHKVDFKFTNTGDEPFQLIKGKAG